MISLLRNDDRLIHGQCMTNIVKRYDINLIIAIDDYTSNNAILKRIFMQAVPSNMKAVVCTIAEGPSVIKEAVTSKDNVLVLTKLPSIMLQMYTQVDGLPKEFNIATVMAKGGAIKLTNYACFTAEEIDAVKKLSAMGVHIWFNLVPGQPVVEWNQIKDKY